MVIALGCRNGGKKVTLKFAKVNANKHESIGQTLYFYLNHMLW